jgi:D-3-phosphoglycerate dehydrogenase
LSAANPLATLENVLFTPHFAGYSESAKTDLRQSVAESVLAVLSGEWPKNVLNTDVAKHLTLKEPSQERSP